MNFWLVAAAIPLVAALVLTWPLLRGGHRWLSVGLALLILLPLATLMLYQQVGTPQGISVQPLSGHASGQPGELADMAEVLAQARSRLEAEPDDLEGWVLLARSYKTLQQFQEAEQALRQAQRLAPDDPRVLVELSETLLFLGGGAPPSPEARELLTRSLELQPDLPKAMWLQGIVAAQDGDDRQAIDWWERLLGSLEPGSEVARSIEAQIAAARQRLGEAPPGPMAGPAPMAPTPPAAQPPAMPPTAPPTSPATVAEPPMSDGWAGVTARVTLTESGNIPGSAVLFLVARDPSAPNPPLGAMRIPNPRFPLEVTLTDANSMMAQRPISSVARIEISARLALSGSVAPTDGDWRSPPLLMETAGSGERSPSGALLVDLNLAPP